MKSFLDSLRRRRGLLALGALLGLLVAWKLLPLAEWIRASSQALEQLGPWGFLVFVVAYLALATASFPTTPLNVMGGVLFGLALGFAGASVGAFLSSLLAFFIARHFGREHFRKKICAIPLAEVLLDTVEAEGFKSILLLRLNPVVPAGLKNFGFALTSVSWREHALATFLGQTPLVLLHVYLGWAGGAALIGGGEARPEHLALAAGGVLLSVAFLGLIAWKGRKRLAALKAD